MIRKSKSAKAKTTSGYQNTKKLKNQKNREELKTAIVATGLVISVACLIYAAILWIIYEGVISNPDKSHYVYAACSLILGYVVVRGLVKIYKRRK